MQPGLRIVYSNLANYRHIPSPDVTKPGEGPRDDLATRAPLSLSRRDNIQNGYIESNKSAIYERQEEKLLNLPGGPYTGMKRSSAVGTTATKETAKRKTWRKRDDLRGTCATFHFRSCNPDSRGSKVAERAVSETPLREANRRKQQEPFEGCASATGTMMTPCLFVAVLLQLCS